MNRQDSSTPQSADISAHYRAIATETTPPELDRSIIRAAHSATRRNHRWRWHSAWQRPAAVAATFAVALLLTFNDSPTPDQAGGSGTRSNFQDAALNTARNVEAISAVVEPSLQPPSSRLSAADTKPLVAPTTTRTNLKNAADTRQGTVRNIMSNLHFCSAKDRAAADQWWQCAQNLRSRGRLADADAELSALRAAFPDYLPAK